MHENNDHSQKFVAFSFIMSVAVVFAYIAKDIAPYVAATLQPEAKNFLDNGGQIATWKLDVFRYIQTFTFLGTVIVGMVVGYGFYIAWRDRNTKSSS